jgi:tetratricopeptide (TPR) repeat protein
MYLAIALARLDDYDNACAAYEKACGMDPGEPAFRLNYGGGRGRTSAGAGGSVTPALCGAAAGREWAWAWVAAGALLRHCARPPCAAVMLHGHGDRERAREQFHQFQQLFQQLDGEAQAADQELVERATQLGEALLM